MTTNAIPSPLMEVMDQALTRADVWRRETVRDGLSVGSLAFAADVVDRLNAEGYVIVRAEGIQALWHENEHLKQRLAEVHAYAESDPHMLVGDLVEVLD